MTPRNTTFPIPRDVVRNTARNTARITALATALVASSTASFAQEDAPPKTEAKTKAATPALILETADLRIGSRFLAEFDAEAELPDLSEKQYYRLTLTSDGKVRSIQPQGDPGWIRVTAHPGALVDLYAKEIDREWEQIGGAAIIGLTQLGMSTKDGAVLMKKIRDFPKQMQSVRLTLNKNPEVEFKGLEISLSVTPTKDSWLDGLTKRLRPHPQGAPHFASDDPMFKVAVAVDPEGMDGFLAPAIDLFSRIGTKSAKERERAAGFYNRVAISQDGSIFFAGDPLGGELRSAGGLRDSKAYAKLLHGEDWENMIQITEKLSPMVETEFEAAAFKHRDVAVAKTIITTEIDTPMAPAGDRISYTAVAGDLVVNTQGTKTEEAKKLIDMAIDRKIKRSPLHDNSLAVIDIKIMELLDKAIPFGNPLAGDENAPKRLRILADSKGGSLNLSLAFH